MSHSEYDDFKEIAYCGGRITFSITCDAEGRHSSAIGFEHSGPGPAATVGVYADLFTGRPVLNFRIGGMGQPFDPQAPDGCIPVFLGSDSRQCWGHQCPGCSGYFRNGEHPAIYHLTCPYCGLKAASVHFLTTAQRAYVKHYVATITNALKEMGPGTQRELVIDMDAIADQDADKPKPNFYYTAQTQQTRYHCEHCGEFNDIRGKYGYCASCGWRNNFQSLRRSFDELREKLNTRQMSAEDAVRSSVSEFDACCRDLTSQIAKRTPMKPTRRAELDRPVFHDMDSKTIKLLESMFDVDLFRGLDSQLSFLKKMMHRRHVFEHRAGVADERYILNSGDTETSEGALIRETVANAHQLLSVLDRATGNFDKDFHEIFAPTAWPIAYFNRRRQQRADSPNSKGDR